MVPIAMGYLLAALGKDWTNSIHVGQLASNLLSRGGAGGGGGCQDWLACGSYVHSAPCLTGLTGITSKGKSDGIVAISAYILFGQTMR